MTNNVEHESCFLGFSTHTMFYYCSSKCQILIVLLGNIFLGLCWLSTVVIKLSACNASFVGGLGRSVKISSMYRTVGKIPESRNIYRLGKMRSSHCQY